MVGSVRERKKKKKKKQTSCHACQDLSLNSQKQNKARKVARIKFYYSDGCDERQTQEKPGRFLLTNIGTGRGSSALWHLPLRRTHSSLNPDLLLELVLPSLALFSPYVTSQAPQATPDRSGC